MAAAALQFSVSSPNTLMRAQLGISSQVPSGLTPLSRSFRGWSLIQKKRNSGGECVVKKCSFQQVTETEAVVGQVTEVNKHNFWSIVEAAGNKTVVLDMYTQWCGPCKVMAPKFEELSNKYTDVVFLKLDCNKDNKDLAKELGMRVVPTFKILKEKKIVKEVRGAKYDDLVMAIQTANT